MKSIRILIAFGWALATFATLAADVALPAGVARVTSVEGITEYTLPNGLRVLFAPDASKPTTTVNTTYMVGSRHENYGETGMAHLLEHLLFKGTPTYPMAWNEFTRRGLRANGSTWTDRTNYFASMAANEDNLEWYLKWSADAMTKSFIARKDLDSEMTVVRNEMESGENNPLRALLQHTMAASFLWHSYGKSTIGARADVENVSIERLQAFYRNYYQPDNAVLIVTGRFDEAKTLVTIAREFGKIPRPARKLLPGYTVDPEQQGERTVTLRRVGDTQLAMAVYHVPAGGSPDYAAVELLTTILADTPSGRLHKALVETKQAASVLGIAFEWKEPTVLILGAQLPGSASLETARATLVKTLDAIAAEPVTQAEVDRARTKYLKDFEQTVSDPEKIGVALSTSIAMGDWRLFFLQRDQVRKAKAEDVQRVAAAYLVPDNRTLGLFIPTPTPKRPPAPMLVDVAPLLKDYKGDAAVAQGEAFEATPENIDARTERAKLANGMKVALLSKRTRAAAVNARLVLHLGDERSLMGSPPVGSLTAAMLNRGAAGMTRQDIQDAFDRLKARVVFSGDSAAVAVSIETTRENLPEVLRLVAKVLREPTFPAPELEQLKNERVTEIESQRKEPNALARQAVARHGNPYPRGHVRYEPLFDESIADINAVTVERIRAYYSGFYGIDSADFAAVGDFDAGAVKAQLQQLFAGWKSAQPYARVANPLYALPPTSMKLETPDKANAFFITLARIPLRDDDPDYPAFLVANHIFGGGTASILWKRIREKEGISYGINSGMNANAFEPHTTWTTAAIYAPQNLPRLQQAFAEELGRAYRDGFTAEELMDAKTGLLQARRLARAQDGAVAQTLAFYLELDRTMAYQARVDRAIEALTLGEVNAAFRKYIDPAKLAGAYAGDFAKAAK
ncbi:MAG: insulinase family protein [Burkholderiales bacterium]|nr:insulinase family protein [Burkholderiales bacterium]